MPDGSIDGARNGRGPLGELSPYTSCVSISPGADGAPSPPPDTGEAVTVRVLRRMAARREPFACLTCYDATTARLLERAGVHVLLVGDSAAEVVLGFPRTIDMPLEVALALTAAVKRGAPRTLVMGDMPFMSYQAGADAALANAGRFMVEGRADVVKIEADESFAPLVRRMSRAGVAVCAHVGSRPQQSALAGGYGPAGRTAEEALRIVDDAAALEDAGAVMLLVEAVPDEVTERIMAATKVPLIGIGAGSLPHGQVLVVQDLLGMTDTVPRFAEPAARLGPAITEAGREWVRRVARRDIGGRRYTMPGPEAAALERAIPPGKTVDPSAPASEHRSTTD